jgi:hypothetical protein
MNDKLNTLTARVITAETDIVHVKSRVADLEASSQGTGNLFDDVKEKTDKLSNILFNNVKTLFKTDDTSTSSP